MNSLALRELTDLWVDASAAHAALYAYCEDRARADPVLFAHGNGGTDISWLTPPLREFA